MTIFEVSTFVVMPEKEKEFTQLWQRLLKMIKKNKKMFKELKSLKLFTQMFGGVTGTYVELAEYDSLADYEKLDTRILKDEGFMKLYQKFGSLLQPGTISSSIWKSVD